ncbi:predicted protein [Nematostella vectensis]|uniref:Solute carrier family 35 member F1 n=1 Tax=Nematostella vectensis TaxID=45351 RepID=A7SVV2_NEMVE|nr:predicted protein [Nematostella vectensis]|eukprot:XP_001624266.1 predicted protein [Nematostella vectensis]
MSEENNQLTFSCSRRTLLIICFGQLMSLCLCGTSVFSQLLASTNGIETPTSQSFLNYILLMFAFTSQLVYDWRHFVCVLKERGWKYFLLALTDVEANFLVVKAYQYTNLTSIQVLDCFALVTVLALSFIFLKVRYKWIHYGGIGVCLVGIACMVTADYFGSRNYGPGTNQVIGDILVLSGSVLYGVSNVAQEFVVKKFSKIEFLGMLGLFGSVISGIQVAILERHALEGVTWSYDVVLYFLGFAVVLFLFYALIPNLMKMSSAAMVNLSILTADFYTLLFGLFLFKDKFSALYFVAFVLTFSGVVIYNTKPEPRIPRAQPEDQYAGITQDSPDLQLHSCCQRAETHGNDEEKPIIGT